MKNDTYLSEEELNSLIADVEENHMVQAPFYLKNTIMEQAKVSRLQPVPVQSVQSIKSAKIQFMKYSFKVMLATAAAVAVLFLAPAETRMDLASSQNVTSETPGKQTNKENAIPKKMADKSNQLCDLINKVTNQLIGKEDIKYETKKEK